jgi:hypothetical protein
MMKTQDEIVTEVGNTINTDLFGFRIGNLLQFLSFEKARKFLKDEATEEQWKEHPLTREAVIAEIRDYMPFAWQKANSCRGLSAMRSISHMQAWLWLLGADQAAETIEDYSCYGKPQLRSICEKLNIDWQKLDDGRWRDDEFFKGSAPFEGPDLDIPTE